MFVNYSFKKWYQNDVSVLYQVLTNEKGEKYTQHYIPTPPKKKIMHRIFCPQDPITEENRTLFNFEKVEKNFDQIKGIYIRSFPYLDLSSGIFNLDYLEKAKNVEIIEIKNVKWRVNFLIFPFPKLKILKLNNCKITNAPILSKLTHLTKLDITHNLSLTQIPSLNDLKNLTELNISHNKLAKLPNISQCQKLKLLDCSYNKIRYALNISSLIDLEILEMTANYISELPPLNMLKKLKKLFVNKNNLTSLPLLPPKLQEIKFTSNKIKDITTLANCTQLTLIKATFNKIVDITPMLPCQKIQKLDIGFNKILYFPPINLSAITYINFWHNFITLKNWEKVCQSYQTKNKNIKKNGYYHNFQTYLTPRRRNNLIKFLHIWKRYQWKKHIITHTYNSEIGSIISRFIYLK